MRHFALVEHTGVAALIATHNLEPRAALALIDSALVTSPVAATTPISQRKKHAT